MGVIARAGGNSRNDDTGEADYAAPSRIGRRVSIYYTTTL